MIRLSVGTRPSKMIALSGPDAVLTPRRTGNSLWVGFVSTSSATSLRFQSASAAFGPVVPHTVPSWPGDLVHLIAVLCTQLFTSLGRRSVTCHYLTSLLSHFKRLCGVRIIFISVLHSFRSSRCVALHFFVMTTARMMIAFSVVIGNLQCSPCSLHLVSKSANSTSVGQSMLKNLHNSDVFFRCASKWLFSS